jgi:cell wall-associated NlpC family hydrolase
VAAIVLPTDSIDAFGTSASSLGPSSYSSSSATVLSFAASSSTGQKCRSAHVTLSSLSLFDGAVSASRVQATNGEGTVTALEVNGAAVRASAGETVGVGNWGLLTLGATVGRVTAPLVLRLRKAHGSLSAGTAVAVGFSATARPAAKPTHARSTTHHARKHAKAPRDHKKPLRRSAFWAHYTFPAGGLVPGARKNVVVSLTLRYLGIPYVWAGAKPKTGFDCSGLVQYVFARLGVLLPHNAAAQWHSPDTVWVKPSRLQPGDLVFFKSDGTRKMPGHVGIYIGGGDIIDAPHTGSVVRVDSFRERWFARQFVGAKRVAGVALTGDAAPVPELASDVSLLSFPRELGGHLSGAAGWAAFPVWIDRMLGELPLGAVSNRSFVDGARWSALRDPWLGIGIGMAALLAFSGAFTYRRRRAPEPAGPSSGACD